MKHLIELSNVPFETLQVLKDQLEHFGAEVVFATPTSGRIKSLAGELGWEYKAGALAVSLIRSEGHFTVPLLIGRIRQTIEEAIEIVRRRNVGPATA